MAYEQLIDINALYRSLFGRTPDTEGLQHWQAQAPGIVEANGIVGLREQMAQAAAPNDQQQYQRTQTAGLAPQTDMDWTSYMATAGLQDRGINSMPGVFSDYGSLAGASPAQNQAALYRSPSDIDAILKTLADRYGNGAGGLGGLGGMAETKPKSGGLFNR